MADDSSTDRDTRTAYRARLVETLAKATAREERARLIAALRLALDEAYASGSATPVETAMREVFGDEWPS